MDTVEKIKIRFLEIKESFENGEDDEQLVYDLEEKIQDAYHQLFKEKEVVELEKLDKQVQAFKRENDFYDAETELDHLFPNRHDEDFDEDSMTYDSVYGDD